MKKGIALAMILLVGCSTFAIDRATIKIELPLAEQKLQGVNLIGWGGLGIEVLGLVVMLAGLSDSNNKPGEVPALGWVGLGLMGGGLGMGFSVWSDQARLDALVARYKYVDSNFDRLAENDANDIWFGNLRIGASPEVAIAIMGKPQSVNVSRGIWGIHEQWVYAGYRYLYFENGVLTSMQY